MNTLKYFAALTIPGLLFLIAIFLPIWKIFLQNVSDNIPENLDKYLPYLSATVVAISYLLSILLNFFIVSVAKKLPQRLQKLLDVNPSGMGFDQSVKLLHYGSDHLNREVHSRYGTIIMFRLMLAAVPFLGLGLAIWNWESKSLSIAIFLFSLLFFLFGYIFFYKKTRNNFDEFVKEAIREIDLFIEHKK